MKRLCSLVPWILVLACSASGGNDDKQAVVAPGQGGTGGGAPDGVGGDGGSDPTLEPNENPLFDVGDIGCTNGCAFSLEPIFDGANISAADITPFADPEAFQAGSLCVVEPQLSSGATPGALFPRNWLRPRFRWVGAGDETLWEIRLHTEREADDLRAYTRDTQWLLPADIWAKMRDISAPVTVTIRGLSAGGALTGVRGDFEIAPVDAGGSMVFWSTSSSEVLREPLTNRLLGFSVGDEGVIPTLSAPDVKTSNILTENGAELRGTYANPNRPTGYANGQVECVGCHVSTPDGSAVVFTDNWPWNKVVSSIAPETRGQEPAYMGAGAVEILKQPWLGMQALSPSHFQPGDYTLVTSYGSRTEPFDAAYTTGQGPQRHELAWFDLEYEPLTPIPPEVDLDNPYGQSLGERKLAFAAARNVGFGLIATVGETRSAVTPTWTHGATAGIDELAYVSTDLTSSDGHPDWRANVADIRTVPYNNRAGGPSTPVVGASDPNFLEYYPEYSSDDAFIAFARAPNPSLATRCVPTQTNDYQPIACPPQDLGENPDGPYYNRNGEIHIVPRQGGTPIRLAANDPVSCTGETARGSINSWPKWSPRVVSEGGKSYYFLIFSSARDYDGAFLVPKDVLTPDILPKSSQLYMATIVVDDATQAVTTYPAIYLWNQNILVDPATGDAALLSVSNLTPAWDDFSIPAIPPPITIPR